jgi:hypothetical protein
VLQYHFLRDSAHRMHWAILFNSGSDNVEGVGLILCGTAGYAAISNLPPHRNYTEVIKMCIRNRITAGLTAVTVAFGLGACDDWSSSPSSPSSPSTAVPQFQNSSRQFGLVNVSTGDVALLNNVNLAVAAQVLATVCDLNVDLAVLATQVVVPGGVSPTECTTLTDGITIEQALPGAGPPSGPGGNQSRQAGLVNVSLGDVDILNNVNAGIAANVLITACDLTVAAAVLAVQGIVDEPATCETDAGTILIDQSQA